MPDTSMSIVPLPQFEEDLAQYLREKEDREAYERLNAPSTMVVRFGVMRLVGEFPYDGDSKPGCGSKIVVRTHRGTEVGEMLTSTCENAGCSKSVTRKEMLEYIENSGGQDYPFLDSKHNKYGVKGRALRVATAEDLARQNGLPESSKTIKARAQELSNSTGVKVKIVEAEQILGGEMLTVYYLSEERVDFGPLLSALKSEYADVKVELKQIGARDEARITADYERCGQYCCCKNFLKVLKPVSMRSAKTQKATLDPLKISGRCGRLMCCLRYEDKTYTELKKNLPHRKTRVGTPHGDGIVLDSQILTQLVLVRLDDSRNVAVPVEELVEPGQTPKPVEKPSADRAPAERREKRDDASSPTDKPKRKRRRRKKSSTENTDAAPAQGDTNTEESPKSIGRRRKRKPSSGQPQPSASGDASEPGAPENQTESRPKPKRRRRRSGTKPAGSQDGQAGDGDQPRSHEGEKSEGQAPKKRRRRRRRSGGSGGSGGPGGDQPGSGPSSSGGSD
ncbi:MAG: hypothetical protein Phyf2KO_22820 [Phycisphaerales bacterium]